MRKHILILCLLGNPYQKAEGGFQRTVYEIIEYFKEKDILITVITSNIDLRKNECQQIYSNVTFWEIALNPDWLENQDQLFINADYLADQIQFIIKNIKKSVSIIHSFQWINGYLAIKINPQHEITHIHSIISSSYERFSSGFSLRSRFQLYCEQLTFNAADMLISITESEKKQLIDFYGVDSSKILVIGRNADEYYNYFYNVFHSQISKTDKIKYNSINMKDYVTENQKVFVYVGRIIEYKGIREIIQAWYLLYLKYHENMPPLWIIGGTETSIYQFRSILLEEVMFLTKCEKEHKIYWWGYMESYGISTIFQKSHVLLMHSAFEPGGRVVLESMSAGKPVIATDTGFAQTYIKDWYNGFQIKYQDIKHLAACMEFYILNEYLSSMMGLNAKNTYNILSKNWQYYKKMDSLYYSVKTVTDNSPSAQINFMNMYPLLVDEFPYCDIKNEDKEFKSFLHNTDYLIEEILGHNSYIWKITMDNDVYIAKQVFNCINLNQLWNCFDIQKVHTIWMQYYTSSLSVKYPFIISPVQVSEQLFTYLVPNYEIISDKQVYKVYPALLKQFADYEYGILDYIPLKEQIQYFKKLNHSIQYKHKYYTMDIYMCELQQAFQNNKELFESPEIALLDQCFQKIKHHISQKQQIHYGLNYGKSLLNHVINKNHKYYLLPSSDIFIGELGQDEGIIFTAYYLKNHTLLNDTYYILEDIIIWCLLYCMELLISSKILWKPSAVLLSDLKNIFDEISNEK